MIRQLSAQDAQFLYAQAENTLTHVMGIHIYDPSAAPGGQVRYKDIIRHIESRLDTSPVFKRRLYRVPFDLDYPYWVEDPHFDLEAHMSHARLPEPGDWRQFCILTARHFSRPMDMNRPLWDVYVVEGLDRIDGVAPGSYALLHRMHHAAIDGASATHSFIALSDKDAAGTPALELTGAPAELGRLPQPADVLRRALASNLTSPVKLLNALMRFAPAIARGAQDSPPGEPAPTRSPVPRTRFNAPISPHKVFDGVMCRLAEFAEFRGLVEGATVNDVVLAICGGALRQYLHRHGELPKAPLVAIAPVNARKSSGDDQTPGNRISAMTVRLATHIADPVQRLQAIRDLTREAKEAKAGLSARLMTDLSKHIPGATMAAVARLVTSRRFAPRQTNLFISNVPGPQYPLYMNGARLTHQFAMAPITNNAALFIAASSYDGSINFSITSDRAIMPDVDFFRECIEGAIEELRDALRKGSQPARTRGAKASAGKRTARRARKKRAGSTSGEVAPQS